MRQMGRVRFVSDGGQYAVVAVERMSACSGCHKADPGMGTEGCASCRECSVFPQEAEMTVTAVNRAGAAVGDPVLIETETGTVIGYAAAVFLLPLLLALCGGLLGRALSDAVPGTVLGAAVGFVLAFVFLRLVVDRRASRKTVYTVVTVREKNSGT